MAAWEIIDLVVNPEVSGKLEIYKKEDQPQIKVRDPSQLRIVTVADGRPGAQATGSAAKPAGRKGKSKSTVDFRKYFCR